MKTTISCLLLMLSSAMLVQAQTPILYYKMDNSGKNESSSSYSFTPKEHKLVARPGRTGGNDGSFQFEHTSRPIETGFEISPGKYPMLSVCMWINPFADKTYVYVFAGTGTNANPGLNSVRNVYLFDNRYFIKYRDNGRPNDIGNMPVLPNEWNFVAICFNAKDSTIKMVANNEVKTEKGYFDMQSSKLLIGGITLTEGIYEGSIDDFRVYDIFLTDEQIGKISGLPLVSAEARERKEALLDHLWVKLFAIFITLAFLYMLYVNIFRRKPYTPVTLEEMKEERVKSGKTAGDDTATNQIASGYLQKGFESWALIRTDENTEVRAPIKMSQFKTCLTSIAEAKKLMPLDKCIIDRMNELGGIMNKLSKRRFSGSIKLIIFAFIGFVLVSFTGPGDEGFWHDVQHGLWLLLSIIIYWFACLTPEFLNVKRMNAITNADSFIGLLLGAILGLATISATTNEYIVTKWSDGSVTSQADLAPGATRLLFMGIIFLLLIALGFFIAFFAAINFLRNYVLYI